MIRYQLMEDLLMEVQNKMEKRHEHNEVSKFDFHLFSLYVIACQEKHTKLLYWNKIT